MFVPDVPPDHKTRSVPNNLNFTSSIGLPSAPLSHPCWRDHQYSSLSFIAFLLQSSAQTFFKFSHPKCSALHTHTPRYADFHIHNTCSHSHLRCHLQIASIPVQHVAKGETLNLLLLQLFCPLINLSFVVIYNVAYSKTAHWVRKHRHKLYWIWS